MSTIETTTTFLKILSIIVTLVIAASVIATPNIKESFIMYPLEATLVCEDTQGCGVNKKSLVGAFGDTKFVSSTNKSAGLASPYTASPTIVGGNASLSVSSIPQNIFQTSNVTMVGASNAQGSSAQRSSNALNTILRANGDPPTVQSTIEAYLNSTKDTLEPFEKNTNKLNVHLGTQGVRVEAKSYQETMKESKVQSQKLAEATIALPDAGMTYGSEEDKNDSLNPSALSCRYVYSSKKDRLYSQSDFLRGDLAVVPATNTGWFNVPARLNMLNAGAMLAMGGFGNDAQGTSISSYKNVASGGGITGLGGMQVSGPLYGNNFQAVNTQANTLLVSSSGI